MLDRYNQLKFVSAIAPVSVSDNTATTSSAINLQGYRSATICIHAGSLADADATFTVLVQECATSGGSYTDVADADLVGTEAGASFIFSDDNSTKEVGYIGTKQYLKVTITPANNTSAALISAVAVLGDAMKQPV